MLSRERRNNFKNITGLLNEFGMRAEQEEKDIEYMKINMVWADILYAYNNANSDSLFLVEEPTCQIEQS